MNHIKITVLLLTLAFLAGCIPVDDLGDYWKNGSQDPALEGHWKKEETEFRSQDEYLSFENAGEHYLHYRTSADRPSDEPRMEIKVKSIHLSGNHFLMLVGDKESLMKTLPPDASSEQKDQLKKVVDNVSGGLQLYQIKNNTLTLFFLDEQVLQEAIKSGEVAGKIPKEDDPNTMDLTPATITRLDGETARFLIRISKNPKNWQHVEKYKKIANLDEALAVSKAYPTTKDTLENSLVDINQTNLKYFAGDKSDVLLRHLQASPEWKVFDERGQIICYQRERTGDKWKVSLNGYQSSWHYGDHLQTRKLFRFSEVGGGAFVNKYNRNKTIIVSPMAGLTHLNLVSSDQGIESYLVIGKKGLWFEFFEQSSKEPRVHTREAMRWLEEFLGNIREAEDEVGQNGFASKLMPPNGIKKGKPIIDIQDGIQGGIYDVYAWINPRSPGSTFLKVFNLANDKMLSEERIYDSSSERMGWSEDGEQLFAYNAHVIIDEGDWDNKYQARFEIWHSSDKGEEVKLIEGIRMITGWQR